MQTKRNSAIAAYLATVVVILLAIFVAIFIVRGTTKMVMTVPDTETLIRIARRDLPYNETMIQSTIQFADATNSLMAHYHPSNPGVVDFEGTGISSTEQGYKFKITINWNEGTRDWEVWTRTWEPIDLNQAQ